MPLASRHVFRSYSRYRYFSVWLPHVLMVKLDVSVLKYLSKEDFRVLTALEMGMKNHDLVPTVLINTLSNLKFGTVH